MSRHSEINLAAELSYNERIIVHDLLLAKKRELERIIRNAQAELEFVDDLVERTEYQEDK